MSIKKYEIDRRRTKELGQPELQVISGKGGRNHFFCTLIPAKARPCCPRCGNPEVRNQGNIHRDYLDVIPRGDDIAIITITFEFRKAKCLSPDCGCVYYPEITFASPYARSTRRVDNAIVRMVLRGGCSYSEIAEEFEGHLSRQVVGQIFHRRAKELNADQSDSAAWYRELLEEGPYLFYSGVLSRGRRLP